MSDLRRKLFEWLDPDWLEEAGRFPVPGGGHRDHGGDHGGDHDHNVSHLHCAQKCGWLGETPR